MKLNYQIRVPLNDSTIPIVFIHGFLEDLSMWEHLDLEALNRPIILVDIPGHGSSPLLDDHEPSINYFATEIFALFTKLGITTCSIVGHSMGGYVALELIQFDLQIERIVLLNSNFWSDSEDKQKDRVRVADIILKARDLFLAESIPNLFFKPEKFRSETSSLINRAKRVEAEGLAYASLAMRNRLDYTELVKLKAEMFTIIQGELDTIIPLDVMRNRTFGWIEPFIVKDSAHMTHLESPVELMKLLMENS